MPVIPEGLSPQLWHHIYFFSWFLVIYYFLITLVSSSYSSSCTKTRCTQGSYFCHLKQLGGFGEIVCDCIWDFRKGIVVASQLISHCFIDLLSYSILGKFSLSTFFLNSISCMMNFFPPKLGCDNLLGTLSPFLSLKVGDPKQKRKKGIFTKQGGDKEVLCIFPMLTFLFLFLGSFENL